VTRELSSNGPAAQVFFFPDRGANTRVVVQGSSDLSAGSWQTLSSVPALNFKNLHDEITLPMTNATDFFRLASP
jgi:hypothetical protein